jgi:hypothetical protein
MIFVVDRAFRVHTWRAAPRTPVLLDVEDDATAAQDLLVKLIYFDLERELAHSQALVRVRQKHVKLRETGIGSLRAKEIRVFDPPHC